jgi:hypothetical protein
MGFHPMPALLTCGPTLLAGAALVRVSREYKIGATGVTAVVAVCGAFLIAAYAAYVYIYYMLKPSPNLPPWKDPMTLDLGMLFLLAPVGLVFPFWAAKTGASKWVVVPLLAALLVLGVVGLLEAGSV